MVRRRLMVFLPMQMSEDIVRHTEGRQDDPALLGKEAQHIDRKHRRKIPETARRAISRKEIKTGQHEQAGEDIAAAGHVGHGIRLDGVDREQQGRQEGRADPIEQGPGRQVYDHRRQRVVDNVGQVIPPWLKS